MDRYVVTEDEEHRPIDVDFADLAALLTRVTYTDDTATVSYSTTATAGGYAYTFDDAADMLAAPPPRVWTTEEVIDGFCEDPCEFRTSGDLRVSRHPTGIVLFGLNQWPLAVRPHVGNDVWVNDEWRDAVPPYSRLRDNLRRGRRCVYREWSVWWPETRWWMTFVRWVPQGGDG